jgi:hypothetical protein
MKKIEDCPKYVQNIIKRDPLLKSNESGFNTKIGKNLKRFIYISSLAGMGLFFNSCIGGYVTTEPTYVEIARPVRPSNLHIWVDGNWVYSRHTHSYARNEGSWQQPVRGRTYVSGHWQTSAKGHSWTPGYWQRQR